MLIYDREMNEGFLLEVKTTSMNPKHFWIESTQLKKYKKLWGGALLTIIHTPTFSIYCKTIDQINLDSLEETSPSFAPDKKGYSINLEDTFFKLSNVFRLVDSQDLERYIERIRHEVLNKYGR